MTTSPHLSPNAASAHTSASEGAQTRSWLILLATILASSLAFIDGSVVNVGLPAIGRSLHANASDLQWVVNAYLLPLSALLLFGGAAGDRFGRRRLLITGTILFAVASAACALAPTLQWFLIGRAAQGVGAALLMPNSLAILGGAFTGEARGRAIGTWAAAGAIAGAAGPILGGYFIDTTGWRAIFVINLPLAAGAVFVAWRFISEAKVETTEPLDYLGALLATISLGLLTWALTVGSGAVGWTSTPLVALLAGAVGLGIFSGVEGRLRDKALMPLTLFKSKTFIGLSLLTFLLYGALGGLLVLMPYVLIQAAGYSGTSAGAALLPFPLILAATSRLMGGVAGRIGARLPLSIGPMVVAGGLLMTLRIDAKADYWTDVLPAIVVIALGMAGAVAPLTTAVLTSVDDRHTGSASGFNSAVARTGGLVATSLLGVVLAATGKGLIAQFHSAAIVGAVASFAAGAIAFGLIRTTRQ